MISLYIDEDIPLPLVKAMRLQGIQAMTTQEQNMIGKTDEEQLQFAVSRDLVFFTQNVKDFVKLHIYYQKEKKEHTGIIVSKKDSIGILLRKMLHLNFTLEMQGMKNRLEYLHNW